MSVSVCLFFRTHILGTTRPNFTKFSVLVACGCGSVLLWRNFNRLFGFEDDIMFPVIGPLAGGVTLLQHRCGNVVHRLTPLLRSRGCVVSSRRRRRAPRLEETFVKGRRGEWMLYGAESPVTERL